jgi:DNA-binding transcriptional LysR family regulator
MLLDEVALALVEFQKTYPRVRVRCLYADDRRIETLVEHGEADLGLILDPGPGATLRAALCYDQAYELDFLLVTPPNHPLLSRRNLRLRDLLAYPLVVGAPETTSRRRIDEALHREHLTNETRLAVETNSAALTLAYVRVGLGIGITAGHRRGFLGQGLGIRPLRKWFGAARYVFARKRGAYVPPAQQELIDRIREAAQDTSRQS